MPTCLDDEGIYSGTPGNSYVLAEALAREQAVSVLQPFFAEMALDGTEHRNSVNLVLQL